ncbi:MAG: OmpH family outer membrane protein, partial [Planctomycetes bacterium]|nr:OmpH family outer membrane protein [Planctomycetota bacterium]
MNCIKAGFLFMIVLLLALGFTGPGAGEPGTNDSTVKGKIAFLNVSKVLSGHQGLLQSQKEIDEMLRTGEADLNRMDEEIKKLENELMVYSTESL